MSSLAEESADTASLEHILSSIDVSPQNFLQPSTPLQAASLVAAQRILDPIVNEYSVFREVALRGLDVEQVWEQVRLVGEHVAALVEKQKGLPTAPKSNGLHKGEAVESDVNESIEEEGSESENELTNESENETEGQLEDDREVSEEQEEDKEDEDKEDEDKEDEDKDRDEDGSLDDDEFPEHPEADESDEDMDMPASTSKPFKRDAHGLNDKFFSIDDFNRLTELQDAADSDLGDDEIDYFGDPDEQVLDSEDEAGDEMKYADFFAPPANVTGLSRKRKRVQFDEPPMQDELDDDAQTARFRKDLFATADASAEAEHPNVSAHAKQRAAIRAQVQQLEKENIGAKEWMYIGEASSRDRPKNSLLEVAEEIDVERSAKPVPIVTEERTSSLEELIRQRIIANNFDDIKRKLPPALLQKSRAIDEDLDMQDAGAKPNRSLVEIYEQEHLRLIDPTNNPTPLAVSVQKQHAEIDSLWKDLSHQLDTLTSWRFMPAPDITQEHVVANIPAVEMEDARPEAEAGVTMLAPQEVYKPKAEKGKVFVSGVPVARAEMSREDKARARKREGKKRGGTKKEPVVPGQNKDVIDTLKRGGVKIISSGHGKRVRGPNAFKGHPLRKVAGISPNLRKF